MRGDGLSRGDAAFARGTSSRERGWLRAIRLNYFMPSVPSFFRAAYIGSPCCTRDMHGNMNEKEKERVPRGEEKSETKGKRTGQGEGTRRRQRTRTKGRIRRRRKRENHSTFYTSGYCIRIYYNLRIPEENDCGGRWGATGRWMGTVSGQDGREIDERTMRKTTEKPSDRRTDRSLPMRRENISSKQKQGERTRRDTTVALEGIIAIAGKDEGSRREGMRIGDRAKRRERQCKGIKEK